MYTIALYEKDGDVYTDMTTTRSYARAIIIAKALYRLCKKDGIRRRDNGEPYDWPVISDENGNTVWTVMMPEGV